MLSLLSVPQYTNYARITGTFSHTGGLEVLVWEGDVNLLSPRPLPTKPNPISYDNGDHGGELEYCPRFSDQGRYFSEIRKPLKKGTYTVGVYTYDNIYDNGYQGNTPSLLIASGTLRVLN